MMDKKINSLLSLTQKAGKIKSGELPCEISLREKTAKLVIIASDASDNTKKKFVNKCFYYEVKNIIFSDKETLGKAIGRENRAVVSICDEGFAQLLLDAIPESL